MKAWEKHQADLYTLANDILENLCHQQHGYKSVFYYAFNSRLKFLQSDGSYEAQLKLLNQLADKDALEFELKEPSEYTTREMFSKNVTGLELHKELVQLKIKPHVFDRVYGALQGYRPESSDAGVKSQTVHLAKPDNRLILRIGAEEHELNEFRPELPPDRIFTVLANRWPNTKVTRTMLEVEAGIRTSRPLNQIVDKSLSPLARKLFVPVKTPDALLVRVDVVADQPTVDLLLSELST